MGTRGLIGLRFDGQLKGCYNHFDSYPTGLGREVVAFVEKLAADIELLEKFRDNVRDIEWIEDDQSYLTQEQKDKLACRGFNIPAEEKIRKKCMDGSYCDEITPLPWYNAIREFQGSGYLDLILEGFPYLPDNTDFIKDSLFCEYAYVINLDDLSVEFYEGFVRVYGHVVGLPGYQPWYKEDGRSYAYGACKKVGEKSIYDLEGWMDFYPTDEE